MVRFIFHCVYLWRFREVANSTKIKPTRKIHHVRYYMYLEDIICLGKKLNFVDETIYSNSMNHFENQLSICATRISWNQRLHRGLLNSTSGIASFHEPRLGIISYWDFRITLITWNARQNLNFEKTVLPPSFIEPYLRFTPVTNIPFISYDKNCLHVHICTLVR